MPAMRAAPAPRFYLNMSSVRRSGRDALARWFTHAIEAKANKRVLRDIRRKAKTKNSVNRRILNTVHGWIKKRGLINPRNSSVENEIHLVVVDNASLYHEKPIQETHSPQGLELAKAMNAIGNKYGVFVHYMILTPEAVEPVLRGRKSPSPLAHRHYSNEHKDVLIKTGPGEATNWGLSYISAIHPGGEMLVSRMSDDVKLPMNSAELDGKKGNRNVFRDVQQVLSGGLETNGFFRGFLHNGQPFPERGKCVKWPQGFCFRLEKPGELRYYPTMMGADILHYRPIGRRFYYPEYLHHSAKSTWYERQEKWDAIYGDYDGNRPVEKLGNSFVKKTLAESGVKRKR